MQIPDILFYALASVVLVTLISRMIRTSSGRDRTIFFLFLILYGTLTVFFFLVPDKTHGFYGSIGSVFLLGEIWFLADPLGERFRQHHLAKMGLRHLKKGKGSLFEVVAASRLLSEAKVGALIAIERNDLLRGWCEKGIHVDAAVSRELLFSVFSPECPLHDGAAVIQKDRLMACCVITPISFATEFPRELGTRHRAAIGFSEATDALCLVVSEESGTISLADRGSLYYDLPLEKLSDFLEQTLRFRMPKKKSLLQTCEVVKV